MEILKAGPADAQLINNLAAMVWEPTYREILTKAQLDYMFEMMYSPASLQQQFNERGHQFLLAKQDGVFYGFASYEINYKPGITKIHKLYVLPESQGRGVGALLLKAIEREATTAGNTAVTLNVNRFNKAFHFYTKTGFTKAGEEDIHIGNGYLMEDFIMEKQLHTL
jgi:GNAT superfamily N-acetyltransferase